MYKAISLADTMTFDNLYDNLLNRINLNPQEIESFFQIFETLSTDQNPKEGMFYFNIFLKISQDYVFKNKLHNLGVQVLLSWHYIAHSMCSDIFLQNFASFLNEIYDKYGNIKRNW